MAGNAPRAAQPEYLRDAPLHADNDSCIVLQEVSLRLDQRLVINRLSVELCERRVGVVGRNGSGKSTFARLVAGLILPDKGIVRVDGVDVGRDRKRAMGIVGIIFQNPDRQIIFPTVEEEVAFGLVQLGNSSSVARELARTTLREFGVECWATRAVHTLSQGQRHLVCLLSVMAMRPRYLILDEPFTGPDIPTVLRLRRYLERMDTNVIHITHDPQALSGYDRVLWFDAGQIGADGSPEEILPEYLERMHSTGEIDDFPDLAD